VEDELQLGLSDAERRVVRLVVRGYTNREVSAELACSPKTVEWTLSNVYRKLGVRSRTELVARVLTSSSARAAKPGVSPGAHVSRSMR
jgi:DNA-binding CsgD family transcriptional regulator